MTVRARAVTRVVLDLVGVGENRHRVTGRQKSPCGCRQRHALQTHGVDGEDGGERTTEGSAGALFPRLPDAARHERAARGLLHEGTRRRDKAGDEAVLRIVIDAEKQLRRPEGDRLRRGRRHDEDGHYDAANFISFTASKFCTPPPTRLVT